HYFQGLQAGLAYYHSIQELSWMNVIVVDPLMKSPNFVHVPPKFTTLSPMRVPSGTAASFVLHGSYFTTETDMTVAIGGVPCTNVQVPADSAATFDSGILPPGVLDLDATTFMGTSTWSKAVVSYPAMDLTGTVALGATITISLLGTANDAALLFFSV